MTRNSTRFGMVAVMVPVVVVACATATLAQPGTAGSREAYRLTLQVLGGTAGCTDAFTAPEYYATVDRRDAKVEQQIDAIDRELAELRPRVMDLSGRIEPLAQREQRTRPLSDEQRRELEALRGSQRELALERRENSRQLSSEERQALRREQTRVDQAVQRLEQSMPLTDGEALFLQAQRNQLAPLNDRTRVLTAGRRELRALVAMRTPGALRVYPNDSLQLRLMETDVLSDDVCARWRLALDREVLEQGGTELEVGGRALLRVRVQPAAPTEPINEAAERAALQAGVGAALPRENRGGRQPVAPAEPMIEGWERATAEAGVAAVLQPEAGERQPVPSAEPLSEAPERGAAEAGVAATLQQEAGEPQAAALAGSIMEAAERRAAEAGAAAAALQAEAGVRRRSMTRTWGGVGLVALGLLMPMQQEKCVTVLGLEVPLAGPLVEGVVGCLTEIYTPGVVAGIGLAGTGIMLATVWSDVPAASSLDVGPGRIAVSKTLAW